MELQRLLSLTRKAIDEYNMIEEGDRIAIGISGGKDSLTLLYALNGLRRFYPKKFEIEAITIDIGFGMDFSKIEKLCEELGVRYTVVKTDIKKVVFDERKEENPCSLCAKMRKGALNTAIKELNCNKVAYAHHKDVGFKNKYDLPVAKSKCPVDGYTKRAYVEDLIKQINMETPGVKERMFTAITNTLYKNSSEE